MGSLLIAVFVLLCGWQAYRSAKKSGTWSNKVFFGILAAALALSGLVSIPIYFLSWSTMDEHFGLVITSMLLTIGIGVTVITIYANRWWKAELLKRAGKDQTLGVVLVAFLLLSMAASAQSQAGSSTKAQKAAALRDLLDSGVLTQEQYNAKIQALNAPAEAPYSGGPVATKNAGIFDPTFGGLLFATFAVPADWIFQGGMTQGTGCNVGNAPFFRATSPDGLSGIKLYPPTDFAWADTQAYMPRPNSGCIARYGNIVAADYMKYFLDQSHLELVRDATDPAEAEKFRQSITPFDPQHPGKYRVAYRDSASALVRFKINSIQEMEKVNVSVTCDDQAGAMRIHTYSCAVGVVTTWAPEEKFQATTQMLLSIPNKRTDNPAWEQAWLQRNNAQWAAIRAQNAANTTAFYTALNNQIVSSGEAFRSNMNNQFNVHEQQMAIARQNGDNNLHQQQQRWDAQSRHTDDVVDSILSQQKRYDPTTGQIYKSDSAYTYNWVSTDGKQYYPTNDINDNPNGRGNGSWVMTTNVH